MEGVEQGAEGRQEARRSRSEEAKERGRAWRSGHEMEGRRRQRVEGRPRSDSGHASALLARHVGAKKRAVRAAARVRPVRREGRGSKGQSIASTIVQHAGTHSSPTFTSAAMARARARRL